MAVITSTPVARKTYDCATCTGQIKPGERYLRTKVSPHDESYDNIGQWVTYTTHETPATCAYEAPDMEAMGQSSPVDESGIAAFAHWQREGEA